MITTGTVRRMTILVSLIFLLISTSLIASLPSLTSQVHTTTPESNPSDFGYTPTQTVKTYDPSVNSSVHFDGANYHYTTPYGIYTWTQPGNLWSFINFMGDEVIKQSFFILQYESWGSWLPLLTFKNKQVQSNDTFYEFSYDVFKKKDHVCSVVIDFVVLGLFKPKISVNFTKTSAWDTTGLGDFRWIWDIIPSTDWKYWKNETLVDVTSIDEELPIGNYTRVKFTDNSSQKIQSILDVSDYGAVDFNVGKTFWNSRGFVGVFPVNVGDIDPITYTEQIESFAIAADGAWTDYNLTANKGVPKGAIAEIVIANKNTGVARTGGVITDGSSLPRGVYLHEAEGDGVVTAMMFVKVNATTGVIQCYAETQGDIDFYLLGYFEGCDFTELNTGIAAAEEIWVDHDLTSHGVPPNVVVQILCHIKYEGIISHVGVRANGSVLERKVALDECEPQSLLDANYISMLVKTDENSIIEIYSDAPIFKFLGFYITGYFSSNVDFVEGFTEYSPFVDDSTWIRKTITEAPASAVVSFTLMHEDARRETYCGLREEGSALERRIWEHEAEGGGWSGFHMCVTLNSLKQCRVYCEDASESHFFYMGYFVEYVLQPTAIEQQRKVFKNSRGQSNYYRLQEDVLGDWDFHYSLSGDDDDWTDSGVGVTNGFNKQPSLSIFEDDTNSRLVIVVVYVATDGNLDVHAFAIADASVTIATLWTDDSVATPTLELYNPVICVDASGYIWIMWTNRFLNAAEQRHKLSAIRTTTTYPVIEPSWETTVDVYGEVGSTDYPAGLEWNYAYTLKSELVPLTATADVGVIFSFEDVTYLIRARTLNYSAGIQKGTVVVIDDTVHYNLLHSSVAESGVNSDVFILYYEIRLGCRKWDISANSSADFGTVIPGFIYPTVDSLALSIDKHADPDILYAFYAKVDVPGDVFYKTCPVDEPFGVWDSYYDAGSDPASAWDDDSNAWDGDSAGTYASQVSGIDEDSRLEATSVASASGTGTITKVELRPAHGAAGADVDVSVRPVFDGKLGDEHLSVSDGDTNYWMYYDVTTDTNAPSPWTWDDVQKIDIRTWRREELDYHFYEFTLRVTHGEWSSEETIDDDSEPINWLSASYQDVGGDLQLIYTRMTSKTVGFWSSGVIVYPTGFVLGGFVLLMFLGLPVLLLLLVRKKRN